MVKTGPIVFSPNWRWSHFRQFSRLCHACSGATKGFIQLFFFIYAVVFHKPWKQTLQQVIFVLKPNQNWQTADNITVTVICHNFGRQCYPDEGSRSENAVIGWLIRFRQHSIFLIHFLCAMKKNSGTALASKRFQMMPSPAFALCFILSSFPPIFSLSSLLPPPLFPPFFSVFFFLLANPFLSFSLLAPLLHTLLSLQSKVFVGGVYRADKWQMTIAWRDRR